MLNYMASRRSINFISSRQRRHIDIISSRQRQYERNNQPEQTNKLDPVNFELTKQLTQLTLLTNDNDDTDGTSNMVMFRVSLEAWSSVDMRNTTVSPIAHNISRVNF